MFAFFAKIASVFVGIVTDLIFGLFIDAWKEA